MSADASEIEPRIAAILGNLTLVEKLSLVTGADTWTTRSIPRVGLSTMTMFDGPVGVRGPVYDERNSSVVIPCGTALAATWDEPLVARLARLLASEARAKGAHVLLGPTVNLHRDPCAGRNFECFSEDPLLASRIATSHVRALQACGVAATPKHYVANDFEDHRYSVDVHVDEQTMRELYLRPFEETVSAGAWLIMAAYNSVNGATMTENRLLSTPLRTEWGFDGVVVSDWFAVRSTSAAALLDGTDLAMPGPAAVWEAPLETAVRDGSVSEQALNARVLRLLRLAARVGALTDVEATVEPASDTDPRRLVREASAQSMVLVKNFNQLLPLDAEGVGALALIGRSACNPLIQGGGSAAVVASHVSTPLESIREHFAERADVRYSGALRTSDRFAPARLDHLRNPLTDGAGVRVTFRDAMGNTVRTEDRHAAMLHWVDPTLRDFASVEIQTEFIAELAGTYYLSIGGLGAHRFSGRYELHADGHLLIRESVAPSGNDQPGIASDVVPTSIDLELAAGQAIAIRVVYEPFQPASDWALALCAEGPFLPDDDAIRDATAVAGAADTALVFVDTGVGGESEGFDRKQLGLPGRQDDLVAAVAAANPRTIVIVNAGAPVEMPWAQAASAILLTWFPGQEYGAALTDVLTGAREPGGRLPTTWPRSIEDIPIKDRRPVAGVVKYTEGLDIGYRAWASREVEPLFPFGHGLGYTEWEYESAEMPSSVRAGESLWVRVRLRNTGPRFGREIVQVYLERSESAIRRPACWLSGFATVNAQGGDAIVAEIKVSPRQFMHWSVDSKRWEIEPGRFTVSVGRSAAVRLIRSEVTVSPDTSQSTDAALHEAGGSAHPSTASPRTAS